MTTESKEITITIRRMRIDDLDQIQLLYAEQESHNQDPVTRIRVSPVQHAREMRRLRQQWITEQKYLAFVATIHDENNQEKCVGYMAAIIETQARLFEVESIATIGELWVLPEYRRRGIGRTLAHELLDVINQIGIQWVTVQLNQQNAEVQSFFKNAGFTPAAIEMRRNLNDHCVTDDSETDSYNPES